MAVPARYGGRDATAVDRFVVVEELLRWGAPVGHHWVADLQIVRALSPRHRRQAVAVASNLPGRVVFLHRHERAGRRKPPARRHGGGVRDAGGGWRVSGIKVWTSNAMRADFMIALCRTGEGARHEGLSRFLIDMRSTGVTVNPIPYLNGSTDHFAEVVLDGVLVSDEMVIGEIGHGWAQNANELAFERSGPVRPLDLLDFLPVQAVHPRVAGPGRQYRGESAHRRTRRPVLGAAPAFAGRGQGDRRAGCGTPAAQGCAHRGLGHPVRTGRRERAAGVVGP